MKKSGIIAIIILVGFIIFTAVKLTSNKKVIDKGKTLVDRTQIPVSVNVQAVEMLELKQDIQRPSVVEPNETASIAAAMPGRLEMFSIELGSKVTKGQVIGKIDTKTIEVQKENLQLALNKMESDYLRNKELYEGNALSEMQYLDTKFGYESRQLELQQINRQLEDGLIKSPISGVITGKNNLAGEFVGAGTPLATVVDVSFLKVFVYLNQSEVRFVELGQDVEFTSAINPGKTFKGKITYIAPSADMNYNYKVEIKLPSKENEDLRSGTYVTARFKIDTEELVLQIPKRALVEGVKNAYVFVQNKDRAEKRVIHVGRENGEYIEVVEGLQKGEKVIVDGQINIVDNSLIQAQ